MSWTPERVALLRTRWTKGASPLDIAREMGGVTRNAVIGKAATLGLLRPSAPTEQERAAEVMGILNAIDDLDILKATLAEMAAAGRIRF